MILQVNYTNDFTQIIPYQFWLWHKLPIK